MDGLSPFFDELASGEPIPGGGSVAALQVAMSGALLSMVCNLTIGRKRYVHVQDEISTVRAESERLRARALEVANDDARAYGSVSAAMRLPRDTPSEQGARTRAIQSALQAAVQPPLACMELSTEALGLAEQLMRTGNRNAISDVGVAALAATAGYRAAQLNVDINLAAVHDAEWVTNTRAVVQRLGDPSEIEGRILVYVRAAIAGEPA